MARILWMLYLKELPSTLVFGLDMSGGGQCGRTSSILHGSCFITPRPTSIPLVGSKEATCCFWQGGSDTLLDMVWYLRVTSFEVVGAYFMDALLTRRIYCKKCLVLQMERWSSSTICIPQGFGFHPMYLQKWQSHACSFAKVTKLWPDTATTLGFADIIWNLLYMVSCISISTFETANAWLWTLRFTAVKQMKILLAK